jgi:hypothetical protein
MGEGAEEWRAETKRSQHAEKENDVSRRSKEDCCCAKAKMGESKGCSKEVCLENPAAKVESESAIQ